MPESSQTAPAGAVPRVRARGRTGVPTLLAAAALLAATASGMAQQQTKGPISYRWVDEHGEVHYGDRIPPQYSQQESALLNSQGVQVGKVAAQRTAAQAEEDARHDREEFARKQRDNFLLTTYTSVKDIEELRDERLTQLAGQRQAAELYTTSLRERLAALQTRAEMFKPYNQDQRARRMPDDLAEDMARAINDLRVQRNAIAAKDQEEAATRAQFQSDIDRFRELHAAQAAR